jgi:hypothetical protein
VLLNDHAGALHPDGQTKTRKLAQRFARAHACEIGDPGFSVER